ncbi:hypothetical protein RIF29_25852 [Crotalaria pallida]|uniref:Uncharacterized protein n=1 Tax=Crotalaria pallida TaxID=3830 RepID=A0AAN9EMP9_CROPI
MTAESAVDVVMRGCTEPERTQSPAEQNPSCSLNRRKVRRGSNAAEIYSLAFDLKLSASASSKSLVPLCMSWIVVVEACVSSMDTIAEYATDPSV